MRNIGKLALVAALVVAAAAAAFSTLRPWWRARALDKAPRPLSVLLVTLDTTRADRLGCYGDGRAETPQLDKVARHGVLFRQAYAHVPLTCPSHASLLTGLLPTRHGVRDNGGYVLSPSVPTLAERFVQNGHRTGAFVSAFVLDRRFGLGRGFETYFDRVPGARANDRGGDPSGRSVRAEETVGRALKWLDDAPARPFFLWVHLFDPHHPYTPPEPYASRFRDDPYRGEIAYMDSQVGRLFDVAAKRGALVAVIGDHGEGLGDHQEVTHSYFIYSNTQRVPFLLSLPGHIAEGREVNGVVRGVDLTPTLLDLAGLATLPSLDGASLRGQLVGGNSGDAGPAYLESYHPRFWWGAQELLGLRSGPWLFIEAPRPELYEVNADPAERMNLAGSRPVELDALRGRLRALNAGGAPPQANARMDPQTVRNLRALGYLGAGQAPLPAEGPLPDPKDNGPVLEAVTRGHDFLENGKPAEALGEFQRALALNPRSASVREREAETLLQLGRFDDAFRAYAELGGEAPGETAFLGMAKARRAEGRATDALTLVRAGRNAHPDSASLDLEEARLLYASGDWPGVASAAGDALKQAPGDEAARLLLGQALVKQRREQEGIPVWLALAEESPSSPEAQQVVPPLLTWSDAAMDRGAFEDARRGYAAVVRIGDASEAVFLNLGLALWRLKRFDDAFAALQRGTTAFPASADLHYRIGRLLEGSGRTAEAAAAYKRVLEIAPKRQDAADALAKLRAR